MNIENIISLPRHTDDTVAVLYKRTVQKLYLFVTIGMGICLLSAYVNSFFMWLYGVDGTVAAIEITPVCEELLKLLPLLFYFLIFEPEPRELPMVQLPLPQVLQPLKMHAT